MLSLGRACALVIVACCAVVGPVGAATAETLSVLTTRDARYVTPALRAFAAATGIEVVVKQLGSDLIATIAADGERSAGDVLLMEEFGPLLEAGITQPMDFGRIESLVPAAFRDPERHWTGLSRHARLVYASKAQVSQTTITYEELADPKWKGKICSRSGVHPYSLSLTASMIAHHGLEGARRWLVGLKTNLARKPQGNDRSQVQALAEGVCQLAIANSYYMAEMEAAGGEQQKWAASARLMFPNAGDRGSHVTVSGIAVLKHTRNHALAMKLIEYLVSPEGQQVYAIMQYAYPVSPGAPVSRLAGGGESLVGDQLLLSRLAQLLEQARALSVEVDFDGVAKL
jgi:iron(III) transport system substrate-binding protein